jgi:hypothetical protein
MGRPRDRPLGDTPDSMTLALAPGAVARGTSGRRVRPFANPNVQARQAEPPASGALKGLGSCGAIRDTGRTSQLVRLAWTPTIPARILANRLSHRFGARLRPLTNPATGHHRHPRRRRTARPPRPTEPRQIHTGPHRLRMAPRLNLTARRPLLTAPRLLRMGRHQLHTARHQLHMAPRRRNGVLPFQRLPRRAAS